MSFSSTFTFYAPGAFDVTHPDRFYDVAYNVFDPNDIRLTVKTDGIKVQPHLDTTEAREFALRLLIAINTPHHIVKELLELQKQAGAPEETKW